MTPRQAGALHWQEWRYWLWCAALSTNDSDRRHHLRMAAQADEDRRRAEQATTQKGRTDER